MNGLGLSDFGDNYLKSEVFHIGFPGTRLGIHAIILEFNIL